MFEDGTDFEDTFDTPQGPVSVFAMVHIVGTHLVLEEVLFTRQKTKTPSRLE